MSPRAEIEIDRENSNILPFQGTDSYDYMMDMENYIETQSQDSYQRNAGPADHPQ